MRKTKCLFNPEKDSTDGMVSVSQLQSFMSCPKKWQYGYMEKLTPRVERPYLTVGKLCHKGMQVMMTHLWADKQAGLDTSFDGGLYMSWVDAGRVAVHDEWVGYMDSVSFLDEEIPMQEEILERALSVFEQAAMEFEPWKYEVLTVTTFGKPAPALELHFAVACAGSKGLHGYIDAILKDTTTGCVWCTDYKFRNALSPDEEEESNVQNTVYTNACFKMGIQVTGTMTWQHSNTPASTPSVNKNGTISRAKIKTTWAKYAEFCVENGQDPEMYREEMEDKLSDIEWFRATYEYRNVMTVRHIWADVVAPAAYAVKSAYRKKNPRHMYPWNCKMCSYKSLCQAEVRGYDADAIRMSEYTKRPNTDKTIVDTDTPDVV